MKNSIGGKDKIISIEEFKKDREEQLNKKLTDNEKMLYSLMFKCEKILYYDFNEYINKCVGYNKNYIISIIMDDDMDDENKSYIIINKDFGCIQLTINSEYENFICLFKYEEDNGTFLVDFNENHIYNYSSEDGNINSIECNDGMRYLCKYKGNRNEIIKFDYDRYLKYQNDLVDSLESIDDDINDPDFDY